MAREEVLLTREGYDKLVAEHEELVAVRRLEVFFIIWLKH